jgi:acyl-ACP thioesterase
MKWSENFKVKFHETDSSEVASVSQVFKYIQEAAMCQLNAQHPTYKELLAQKKAFVLSAIRLEMFAPILAYDNIIARSWACPSRGVSFIRCYEIERDGEILCEATSSWALVSTEEKKLYTVEDVDTSAYYMDEPIQTERPARVRISTALGLNLTGEYTVQNSDIDLNGHVNNTNYPRIICYVIPNLEKLRVKSIGIYFSNEAKKGDTLKIYTTKIDNRFYVRTIRPDGKTNVEAELIVEEI